MTRDQLEHAIRAACDVSKDTELWIFGSQAILGEFPEAPEGLRASIEVDVQPKNRPESVDDIDAILGELSQFHKTHGFYVHGIQIKSAKLPVAWEERTISVSDPIGTQGKKGLCVEAHDLAASKLAAYREKDREFVRLLLVERMIDVKTLTERIGSLDVKEHFRERLVHWATITAEELEAGQ
ncbi:MAG: DUF6036 family nucleotidyltransferase [Thermodesulfobacteriota bacterium]|nr:DUF6036 family nucleotidyltransferase [Thermodesulfobacteriota bacterium]